MYTRVSLTAESSPLKFVSKCRFLEPSVSGDSEICHVPFVNSSLMQRQKAGRSRQRKQGGNSRRLNDGPAYSGQQTTKLVLPGTPTLLTTTVTTGVIAAAVAIEPTSRITGWNSRFGSTFDEFRVLGCNVVVRSVAASSGVSKMWFDEKSTSTPTANEAQERTAIALVNSNANAKSTSRQRWRARDLLDLQYSPVGTATQPVTFKVYTDLATWGASAVATPLWVIEPEFIVEFRGIKST